MDYPFQALLYMSQTLLTLLSRFCGYACALKLCCRTDMCGMCDADLVSKLQRSPASSQILFSCGSCKI